MWLCRQLAGRRGCVLRPSARRQLRALGDSTTSTTSDSTTTHVVVQGSESTNGVKVRRARACDVPRALAFVRSHACVVWPHAPSPAPRAAAALVLNDYVARALAQGHSLLAEQSSGARGLSCVLGLALGARVCSWDAALLERCARCVRCVHARRSLHFVAHCLRAPRLHDKYKVHNILQVLMIVPAEHTSTELVSRLARGAVQRAADAGIPLLRVDVTNPDIAKILEELKFKKEWHMEYQVVPDTITEKEGESKELEEGGSKGNSEGPRHFVSVYTAPAALTDNKAASDHT